MTTVTTATASAAVARDERAERGDWGARPQRLGDRRPRARRSRLRRGALRLRRANGYGGDELRPHQRSESFFGAPGYDASFGGPRFDRVDVGSTGTHGVHPVSSPYGGAYRGATAYRGGGFGSSARRYAEHRPATAMRDPHYAAWRNRQIDELDRDYDEYRRENQARFDSEFGAWRERRGQQRQAIGRVTEHMEVVGSDGSHVGTVDGTRGDSIILTRSDPSAGGIHHRIPCGWVERSTTR